MKFKFIVMSAEKKSYGEMLKEEARLDIKKVQRYVGIPLAILAASLGTVDWSINQIERHQLVRKTREKAGVLAHASCEAKSFSPRRRFRMPGQGFVDYECDGKNVECSQNLETGETTCSLEGDGKFEEIRRMFRDSLELMEIFH